jgi:hypothetical protein
MLIVKRTGYLLPVVAAFAAMGCATTSGNLTNSAERLERSAYELREDARDDSVSSSYSRDAQTFAEETRDFHRVVDDRRADDGDVQDAFHDLSKHYHALRDEVDRARDREVADDFARVTESYLDVEREMRKHGDYDRDRDRYARDN